MSKEKDNSLELPKGYAISYDEGLRKYTEEFLKNNKGCKNDIMRHLRELVELYEGGKIMLDEDRVFTMMLLEGDYLNAYVMVFKIDKKEPYSTFSHYEKCSVQFKEMNSKFVKFVEDMRQYLEFDEEKTKERVAEFWKSQIQGIQGVLDDLMEKYGGEEDE